MTATAEKIRERPLLACDLVAMNLAMGLQTQHRVPIRPQPTFSRAGSVTQMEWQRSERSVSVCFDTEGGARGRQMLAAAAPFQPGDRLYVREAFAIVPATAYRQSIDVPHRVSPDGHSWAVYRSGWERSRPGPWKPSIHMPKWAARTWLEVVGEVRVESIQEISYDDAVAEGCPETGSVPPMTAFAWLWGDLYPESWELNEIVWAWNLKRIEGGAAP